MNNPHPYQVSRVLSQETLEEIYRLWRQIASHRDGHVLVTEEDTLISPENASERFALLLWSNWSILLLAKPQQESIPSQEALQEQGETPSFSPVYYVTISWDIETVNQFIQKNKITYPLPQVESTQAAQAELFLSLFDLFTLNGQGDVCRPIQNELDQRVSQEKVLYQVISHIRQSLDLAEILDTTVQEVRDFLQVDRLLIFQFDVENQPETNSHPMKKKGRGKVTYESTACQNVPSLLKLVSDDDCFTYVPHYQEKFRQGIIVTVDDIEQRYSSSFCLIKMLQKYNIYSKMIAPIVVRGDLWGLLIAHQCFETRHWLSTEKTFLGHIGEHLSVAIDQAQLYAEVQKQKNNFEQRVIERTQELKDTLLASQAASRSKNAFLGSVSHELRTPLTSVIGLSATLLHWSSGSASLPVEKQLQYLQSIQKNGKQLLELINEILEFSQLEAGNSMLNIREFSLKKLSLLVLNRLQEEAREGQVELEFILRVEQDEDSFWGDAERVQQILFHLLKNAIKFTPTEGTVTLLVWRENQEAVFQIEDTGIGIPQIHLPRLFERFEQLEKFRERIYQGTGLGLALTKQLVDLHHGRIEVESIEGKGSLFTVWLPDQQESQLKAPVNKIINKPIISLNKTIILIERDEETATLICELLTAAEYQVVWLIDSATAIIKIEVLQPKLVIVDQELSELYKLSQTLRRLKTTKSIKILLLSNEIYLNKQNELDDYLLKPIQPHLLLQRINSLINYDS